MSATLVGAVLKIGPDDRTKRFVMVAIADNADDYGFACPSVETIADMTVCDERTVRRVLQTLEEEAWIRIGRRMLNRGRSNVYFLNVERLQVAPGPKSRKSPLHADLERMMGKKTSADPKPVVAAAPVEDLQPDAAFDISAGVVPGEDVEDVDLPPDISQGCDRTFSTLRPDISRIPILKNHWEPLCNPDTTPQPPLRGGDVDFEHCNSTDANGDGGEPAGMPKSAGDPRTSRRHAGGPCDDRDAATKAAGSFVNVPRGTGRGVVLKTGRGVTQECEKAMRECGISNPRLLRVMEAATRMQMERERMSPAEVRLMMVESWRRWKELAPYMRHSIGPRKFFGEGYWLDEKLWPVDVARMRGGGMLRSDAAVGMYRG